MSLVETTIKMSFSDSDAFTMTFVFISIELYIILYVSFTYYCISIPGNVILSYFDNENAEIFTIHIVCIFNEN